MLGCVVSLTSSHLSGSTIRDVNIGGSVLCLNSSFSSLLSSPSDNAESPSVLLPEGPAPFEDGKEYIFPFNTLVTASVSFSHCHFTGEAYQPNKQPLNFNSYCGSITILSCSFDNIHSQNVQFIGCQTTSISSSSEGGGTWIVGSSDFLHLIGCEFVNCSAHSAGGAMCLPYFRNFSMTDCVVKGCTSATGAIMMAWSSSSATHLFSFTRVQFIENRVGNPRVYYNTPLKENATAFPDFFAYPTSGLDRPLSFDECFTTTIPNCAGMYTVVQVEGEGGPVDVYERVEHAAFDKIGPLLTGAPKVRFDGTTGRLKMEIEGSVPKVSQKYSVRIREELDKTEVSGEIEIVDGTGTFVSLSGESLKFVTGYTITSIVGVVPTSSSSSCYSSSASLLSNGVTVHRAAWPFHLAATPSFVSFTTPECPPSLKSATAYLITAEPNYAYVILLFDKEVFGSFDIVVEEEGQDVTITVPVVGTSLTGESSRFVVVGDKRTLTHDTTYSIKSISPTPNVSSSEVWMRNPVSLHIPKSPYDPKKSMSPETKALLSWLIPLVVSLLVVLLIVIVVFVVVYRRKKNGEPAQKEMEGLEQEDEVKVEDVDLGDNTNGLMRTDGMSHSAFGSSHDDATRIERSDGIVDSQSRTKGELVEVMACSGDFGITSAPMTNTLYSVLHKEHREIGKRGVGIQIVNGLKQVVTTRGWSDVLTRLSSHWILIDGSGNVQLKLQMNASEAEQEIVQAQMQHPQALPNVDGNPNHATEMSQGAETDKTGMDGMRWRAPEVVAGGGKGVSVDGSKASVFSLGLILWEIETGQVPFGELDAVNAQRQSGTGIGPKMEIVIEDPHHTCSSSIISTQYAPTLDLIVFSLHLESIHFICRSQHPPHSHTPN
ncbi:hypothetical protein BLNAU_13537 [Blattamonas nauphoetae]|uniref:Protein kinase domain-containing protein n=1 Tax=Blattamonas nauphoetae TaxID=2049346 RepID=A0ABQ9XJ86_9EUKA|nr:hypothetical protein BLNAU_13537 [Blattamonas nauphoetae]